jgi:hypothetical protein
LQGLLLAESSAWSSLIEKPSPVEQLKAVVLVNDFVVSGCNLQRTIR